MDIIAERFRASRWDCRALTHLIPTGSGLRASCDSAAVAASASSGELLNAPANRNIRLVEPHDALLGIAVDAGACRVDSPDRDIGNEDRLVASLVRGSGHVAASFQPTP